MNNIIFVAGTDTDVGKTIFSNLYSIYLKEKLNKNVILSKPIQSGCIKDKISDLKLYFKLGGAKENSQNSYCLKTPCSIDYASKIDRVHLNKKKIINDIKKLSDKYETVVIEGAGGLMSPIKKNYLFVDLIKELNPKIILVSKIILGMINQTLLSIELLKKYKLNLTSIVFNKTTIGKIDDKNNESIKSICNIANVKNHITLEYKKNILKNKDYFYNKFKKIKY